MVRASWLFLCGPPKTPAAELKEVEGQVRDDGVVGCFEDGLWRNRVKESFLISDGSTVGDDAALQSRDACLTLSFFSSL